MGKLGNISGKEAAKVFAKAGWHEVGQVGAILSCRRPVYAPICPFLNIKSFPSEHFGR